MAHKSLIPKQRSLTETETQTSFESWKESMIFHICLDPKSSRFVSDLKTWDSTETRGFQDDSNDIREGIRMTKEAKKSLLNIILGSIASFAPVISPRFVKYQSTSLECIWDRLRGHYGFRKTGSRALDLPQLRLNSNESREGLWERLYTFVDEMLLTKEGDVRHENAIVTEDEKFTPTLQNILVAIWLNIINPALPQLVKQRFSTELRSNTVFSIREEISDSIPALISEMEEREGLINRAAGNNFRRSRQKSKFQPPKKRSCCLCETAGRPSTSHFLSNCPFLPLSDKNFISRAREVTASGDDDDEYDEFDENIINELSMNRKVNLESAITSNKSLTSNVSSRRVDIVPSPVLRVNRNGRASFWTLDCGAEASLITEEECQELNVKILPTHQQARMADGTTHLQTVGEAHFTAQHGHHNLFFSGLVVKSLDSPVLAGMPFLRQNDISIRYSSNTIFLGDCCSIRYNDKKRSKISAVNKSCASVLRITNQTCVLPGKEIVLQLPESLRHEKLVALEPRSTTPSSMPNWIDCNILTPNPDGEISLTNNTTEPILISKHSQLCQVRPVKEVPVDHLIPNEPSPSIPDSSPNDLSKPNTLSVITVDPSKILAAEKQDRFYRAHKKYENVFSPGIGKYNNYSGRFVHTVNISENLPPQRRGRIPEYNQNDKEILQQKFDYLLKQGVFARAEDMNIPVEYVHPSFLIKKPSGGYRLVTSFGQVAEYARPQPTVTSNVEHVLQQIGQYKYIIKSDLCSAYYQIPLNPESSKFLGVLTPFKGTLVYQRSVMGLPGSEAALEELLSRIFGDIIKDGKMIKMCDDLYIGSNDIDTLADTWEEVLDRLQKNGLKLGTDKTVICPTSTVILGWQWNNGTISPTSHKMNALAACNLPNTVKDLRSFIGCYKFISRVLPCYAVILQPLEELASNKPSNEKIQWSDDLIAAFNKAKAHLRNAKPVILPRREDQLHIVTDASVTASGLASTLYVTRGGRPVIAGYFNATLKKNQPRIIPCEAEALAIGASIDHFSYYILQSSKRTRILTDSRPCVQAYRKLLRGEFSSSPKVTTFLSIASRYCVEIIHISGASNILSDFASRSPVECTTPDCQICEFVSNTNNSCVGEVKVSDVISGKAKVPFNSKESWVAIQNACPDISKVFECLSSGSSLPKNKKNLTDAKRYISCGASLSSNQRLLVIRHSTPFKPTTERIIIPREVSPGLMTAIHIQLNHPSIYQLTQIFSRAFFCLDMSTVAKKVVEGCYQCASLKKVPSTYHNQSTSVPAETIGVKFAADIVKRNGQLIMLIREDISSFTDAVFVEDEKADTLRDGIITVMSRLRSPMAPKAILRTDPASAFRSLVNDSQLSNINLSIDLGEAKNMNKNAVAERGIEEFHAEILRLQPMGGKISQRVLAQSISNINGRIRNNKLSAAEVWTQRDMSTGERLNLNDKKLIEDKYQQRIQAHHSSAKYKARGKEAECPQKVHVGQLVYLYSDRSKLKSRDQYMVIETAGDEVQVQKFTSNQFRQRKYKVKISDLIIIPQQESPKSEADPSLTINCSEPQYQTSKVKPDPLPSRSEPSSLSLLKPSQIIPNTTAAYSLRPRKKNLLHSSYLNSVSRPEVTNTSPEIPKHIPKEDSSSSESSDDSSYCPIDLPEPAILPQNVSDEESIDMIDTPLTVSDQSKTDDSNETSADEYASNEESENSLTDLEQLEAANQAQDYEAPPRPRRPPFIVSSVWRNRNRKAKVEKKSIPVTSVDNMNAKSKEVEENSSNPSGQSEVTLNKAQTKKKDNHPNEDEVRRSERIKDRLRDMPTSSSQ